MDIPEEDRIPLDDGLGLKQGAEPLTMALGSGVVLQGPVAYLDSEALCLPPTLAGATKSVKTWPFVRGLHGLGRRRQAPMRLSPLNLPTALPMGRFRGSPWAQRAVNQGH